MSLVKPYYNKDGITIYHCDNLDVVPFLPQFDLLLTDPPYGINANKMTLGNGSRRIYRGDSDWDSGAPPKWVFDSITQKCLNSIIWGGNYFGLPGTRCYLVWDKCTGGNDYADCELAWTTLDKVVKKMEIPWVGANAKDKGTARVHPTQKPLALMRWCLSLVPDAETILDPFMGSGTTLVAAKMEGRQAVGIEINEKYCEAAVNRLAQGVLF